MNLEQIIREETRRIITEGPNRIRGTYRVDTNGVPSRFVVVEKPSGRSTVADIVYETDFAGFSEIMLGANKSTFRGIDSVWNVRQAEEAERRAKEIIQFYPEEPPF